MKKKETIIGVIFVAVIIVLALTVCVLQKQENNIYYKRGEALIYKIEVFRQQENRLPNNLNELSIEESMNDGPYYEKKDSLNYIVFFNIGFDNTKVYYSDKKEWIDEP